MFNSQKLVSMIRWKKLSKKDRKVIAKQIAELETLIDVIERKEEFQKFSKFKRFCLSKEKGII